MAAKTTAYETSLLQLFFNGTTFTGLAQNATSPNANLYVSLHTSSPGASGNQITNEAAYTSYARVAVARTTGGWTVTSGSVSPTANVVFPQATGGSETETFWGIGTAASGAGTLLYFGPISPTVQIAVGIQPVLTTASFVQES